MNIILTADSYLELLGGKAGALARLAAADLPIPPWFVVSPAAFNLSLTSKQQKQLAAAKDADNIRDLLGELRLAERLEPQLTAAVSVLLPAGGYVAVRSSALDEDGASHSFAGQLDSFLFVKSADVAARLVDVWRSGFSERVLAYRQEAGLGLPGAPAVLVQRMVDAEVSGVVFSADPVTGRRGVAIVSAVYGLGTALVSGEVDADTFTVARDGQVLSRDIAEKKTKHVYAADVLEGVSSQAVAAELRDKAALTDAQVAQVAVLSRHAAKYFGRPQDCEWAFAAGELWLLQSRPITSLAGLSDPDAPPDIWDNSNIVESYGGVTTPLTFSFARAAYEGVYREFLRILGVSKRAMATQENTFKHMLGLINGRVYYNLLSWYKLLATLPGFTVNRSFMEGMMGVKEGLPDEVLAGLTRAGWRAKLGDSFNLARSALLLVWAERRLPDRIAAFYKRLDDALVTSRLLSEMRADELVVHYRALEAKLLTSWDAPLVNDFLAMIFYGVLQRLCVNWCGDSDGTLQNDLVSGEGQMISAEPARRVLELARLAAQDADFASLLAEGPLPAIREALKNQPAFRKDYDAYLARFGDRCLEELKLESPTLHDDPLLLLRSVGGLATQPDRLSAPGSSYDPRAEAEAKVAEVVTNPLKKRVFDWVLTKARARVRDRENLRFERTRLFGHVRRLFLELGARYYALGVLDAPRDVFYLEVDEVLGFTEGVSTLTNLRELVSLRKAEFTAYQSTDAPAERFETRGVVYCGHDYQAKPSEAAQATDSQANGDTLRGTGCCPGVVRAPVRVVKDPREAGLKTGEILVAERTDPGWIMLFPLASGLLVERGSLLSHSAIVAREMNIPAVVAAAGVTTWLASGDEVEFDGSTGVIRKLASGDVNGE